MALKSLVSAFGLALACACAVSNTALGSSTSVPAVPPVSCASTVIELDLHGVEYANVETSVREVLAAAPAEVQCVTLTAICGHGRPLMPVLQGTHGLGEELRVSPGDFRILRRVLKKLRDEDALALNESAEILKGFDELLASYSPNVAYYQREGRSLATVHKMLTQATNAVLSLIAQRGFTVTFALGTKPSSPPFELSFWNDGVLVATLVRLDSTGAKRVEGPISLTSDEATNWTAVQSILDRFKQVQIALDFIRKWKGSDLYREELTAITQERRARMARRAAAQASSEQQRRATAERESERAAAVAVLQKAQASFERDLLDELLGPLFRGYANFGTSARERTAKERLQVLHDFKLDRSPAWVRQAKTAFEKFANTVAQKWTQLRGRIGELHGQTGSTAFWRQWSAPKLNKLIADKLGVFDAGQYSICHLDQQPSSRTHGRCKSQESVMLIPEPHVFAPSDARFRFKPALGDTLQCDTLLLSDAGERARAQTRLTRALGSVHAFLARTCPSVENMTRSLVRLFEQRLLDSVARLLALREDLHVELLQLEQNRAAAVHQAANEMASSFTPKWPVLSDTATGQEIDAFVDTVTTMAETSASTIAAEPRQRAQQLWEQTMASKEAIELLSLDSTQIEDMMLLLKPEVVETDEILSRASAQMQSISLAKAATDETAAFNFFMLRPALHDFVDSSDSLFALASPLKALALVCLRLEEGVVLPLDFSRFDRQVAVFADAFRTKAAVDLSSAENIMSVAKSQKRKKVRDAVIVPTSQEAVSMVCPAFPGQSQSTCSKSIARKNATAPSNERKRTTCTSCMR
ncbi:MAG: hypothetical protein MHM6MM_001264 [Cercozoa sp. M6MM]